MIKLIGWGERAEGTRPGTWIRLRILDLHHFGESHFFAVYGDVATGRSDRRLRDARAMMTVLLRTACVGLVLSDMYTLDFPSMVITRDPSIHPAPGCGRCFTCRSSQTRRVEAPEQVLRPPWVAGHVSQPCRRLLDRDQKLIVFYSPPQDPLDRSSRQLAQGIKEAVGCGIRNLILDEFPYEVGVGDAVVFLSRRTDGKADVRDLPIGPAAVLLGPSSTLDYDELYLPVEAMAPSGARISFVSASASHIEYPQQSLASRYDGAMRTLDHFIREHGR
jgi:hypothetical protein